MNELLRLYYGFQKLVIAAWEFIKLVVMVPTHWVLCKLGMHLDRKYLYTQVQTYGSIHYYICNICTREHCSLDLHVTRTTAQKSAGEP